MIIDISISSMSFQLLIIPEADHNGRFYHLQIFIIVYLREDKPHVDVFVPALTFWVQRSSEMYKKNCLLEERQLCDVLLDNRHPHHLSSICTSLI